MQNYYTHNVSLIFKKEGRIFVEKPLNRENLFVKFILHNRENIFVKVMLHNRENFFCKGYVTICFSHLLILRDMLNMKLFPAGYVYEHEKVKYVVAFGDVSNMYKREISFHKLISFLNTNNDRKNEVI